jgi:PRTRC genetic system ThiF family protein
MMNVFDPHIHIKQITIVGVGGTGVQVARTAARMVYDMQRSRMHAPRIVLIDPDKVEEKNCGRQLFVPAEIGEYKARIIGRRLNLALGLDAAWITEPVNADKHFDHSGSVVISCVDNHLARRELSRITGNHVFISAGNHEFSGQVCISNCGDREQVMQHLDGKDGAYAYLPHESLLFPQLLEPEAESETETAPVSCADALLRHSQSILINDWMSCLIGNYLYALLYRRPITSFLSFIHCDEMVSTRNILINREELLAYLKSS